MPRKQTKWHKFKRDTKAEGVYKDTERLLVRKIHFNGEFEVVSSKTLKIVASGFESEESARAYILQNPLE